MRTAPLLPLFALGAVLLAPGPLLAQGPLTPPGAPAPLFKTLQQIEPRTPITVIPTNLSVSGSYYLVSNLTQTSVADGIVIGASHITVDLNGFTLIGTNGTGDGITRGGAPRTNVWIRNGAVRNWNNGLNFGGGGHVRVENVTVVGNSSHGMFFFSSAQIAGCAFVENGGHGLLSSGAGVTIRNCEALQNGLDGIRVGSDSLVTGNFCHGLSSSGSTNAGIRVSFFRNRVEDNHVTFFPNGIVVAAGNNLIVRNSTALVGTNYTFAAGNSVGPTNQVPGVVTTHPWANFSF